MSDLGPSLLESARRFRGVLMFLGIAVGGFVITMQLVPEPLPESVPLRRQEQMPTVPSTAGSPAIDTSAKPVSGTRWRSYAIPLVELQGLAPRAPSGTRLEVWVTWGRPVTKEPRLQRLLAEAVLQQVAAPVTPGGPYTAILQVKASDLSDLLYADQFGTLSVAALP